MLQREKAQVEVHAEILGTNNWIDTKPISLS